MATIRELPSGKFNVQIRLKNAPTVSRSFGTHLEATQWAESHEARHKLTTASSTTISLMDLARQYCDTVLKGKPSREIALSRVERIVRSLPQDVRELSKQDVSTFRQARLKKVSGTTCRDELLFIHRLYRWAHREMILDRVLHPSPCQDIAIPSPNKTRTKVVDRSELSKLLDALPIAMRPIVELAYETAMRRGEIVKLTAKDIYLDERYLAVVQGKTGDRYVPLTTRAIELLGVALDACLYPTSRLFPVTPHSVSTAVRRARKRAGLDDDVRLHQLRHTRITNVAKKGLNQAQIMMVSGHRDVRSVQRYTHLNVQDVVNLID
jgi:integrase